MHIIDCQIHEPLPWSPHANEDLDEPHRNELSTQLALAAMDAVGVSVAMISSTTRPAWGKFATSRCPQRFVEKVRVDPTAPDVEDIVRNLREQPGVLGIRASQSGRFLPLEQHAPTFRAAERFKVPVSIYHPQNVQTLGEIARGHPAMTLIVEHVGVPQPLANDVGAADMPRFRRLPDVLALAALPNVAVALSGFCTLSLEPFPFPDLHEPLRLIFDAFGPERLMWGSDIQRVQGRFFGYEHTASYPGKHTYLEAVAFFRDSDQLSASGKEALFGGTFRKLYRWAP